MESVRNGVLVENEEDQLSDCTFYFGVCTSAWERTWVPKTGDRCVAHYASIYGCASLVFGIVTRATKCRMEVDFYHVKKGERVPFYQTPHYFVTPNFKKKRMIIWASRTKQTGCVARKTKHGWKTCSPEFIITPMNYQRRYLIYDNKVN